MDKKIESIFKYTDMSEISDEVGVNCNVVRDTLDKISHYFKYPGIIDSDEALVRAYIKVYRKEGKEAARKEVARRITLAKEIRVLKSMIMESGHLIFHNVDDPHSLGNFVS